MRMNFFPWGKKRQGMLSSIYGHKKSASVRAERVMPSSAGQSREASRSPRGENPSNIYKLSISLITKKQKPKNHGSCSCCKYWTTVIWADIVWHSSIRRYNYKSIGIDNKNQCAIAPPPPPTGRKGPPGSTVTCSAANVDLWKKKRQRWFVTVSSVLFCCSSLRTSCVRACY